MSHLIKHKSHKNIYKAIKIIFFLIILFIFFKSFNNYIGNKYNYLTFSLLFNYLIVFASRRNSTFVEIFFSIFLWLGFWFKLSFCVGFYDSIGLYESGLFINAVGTFDYKSESFDKALIISQIGVVSFILSGVFREKFLFNYPKKIKFKQQEFNFFLKFRKFFWTSFILLVSVTIFVNIKFQIYQRGLISNLDVFLISGIIKWLLLFGLTSFGSVLIFFEIKKKKKFLIIPTLLIFLETFLSSISMLSRGMIFNSLAIFLGIYKFSKKINILGNIKYYLKLIILIFILFYISVISVNTVRETYFYKGESSIISEKKIFLEKKNDSKINNYLLRQNYEFLYLAVQRWVGIDGVMAVISKQEDLNFQLFLKSFNEKFNAKDLSFYEKNFQIKVINPDKQPSKNVKGNTLPGIVAFLYYTGNYIFVFIGLFVIFNLINLIEYLAYKLSFRNIIFSAVIGQVMAYRLIHFGYIPANSIMLFGSIIINIFIIFTLFNFFKNKIK